MISISSSCSIEPLSATDGVDGSCSRHRDGPQWGRRKVPEQRSHPWEIATIGIDLAKSVSEPRSADQRNEEAVHIFRIDAVQARPRAAPFPINAGTTRIVLLARTAQVCAMLSMRHLALAALPGQVPSSKVARRYHRATRAMCASE